MTARRPSRISSSAPTQVGLRDGDELQRVLNDLNDGEAAAVLQDLNNRVLPSGVVGADETATPAIHPALTDFGPKSAAKYFRQARTNAHPAIGRPTLSLRAGLRPRNPKSSRCKTAQPSNDLLLPGWQNPGPSINGDLDLYSSENQALPATSSASSDTGKSYRHTDEKLLARERIRWLPRRKNPKRVRRAGAREQTVAETNRPQPRNTFYGRFLQGDMYQGRTAQHARHEHADDISAVWEAQDARQGTPDFEIRGSNGYDMPAYAAQSNDSGQWPLLEPSEDIDPEDDDGLTSGIGPRRTMDSQAVSADGSWRPSQVPGAQRSQTFVGSRPSRLFASSHAMSHFRLPLSEDDVFDMSPEPTKRLSEGSEVTSNSHREDSVTNDELLDMKQMMLQPVASNFDREPPCDEDEGVMLPFLESASKPKTFMEQEGSSWPPSRTTLVSAASSSFEQSSSHHGATPPSTELEDSSNGRLAAQRNLAQRPEAAGVGTKRYPPAPRNSKVSPMPKAEPHLWSMSSHQPPICQPKGRTCGWPNLPTEIYFEIARYISRDDALNLRLVCRDFSIAMMGAVFGSVVVPFGRAMFDLDSLDWDRNSPAGSMFEKYGLAIRKFGISFEADLDEIAKVRTKIVSNQQSSWWGNYNWPTPVYPRFSQLHALENLADNVSILKSAMAHLGKTHELGLSIDSGHGWLNGPDISDMALFDIRCGKSTRVFGKTLRAEDQLKFSTRSCLFRLAQARTLEECIETLGSYNKLFGSDELDFLRSIAVRDLETFRSSVGQPDYDAAGHTGGATPNTNAPANATIHPFGAQQPVAGPHPQANGPANAVLHPFGTVNPFQPPPLGPNHNYSLVNLHQNQLNLASIHPAIVHSNMFPTAPTQNYTAVTNLSQLHDGHRSSVRDRNRAQFGFGKIPKQNRVTQPQFPLIFNGYNLSAEVSGWCDLIQRKVASPKSFPLQPGTLTEAQAQWLMEYMWAQRAFLSAYTTSILANKVCFAQVHSFHIGKISSGLLSTLEQRELWQGLPGLTNLTLLVSPDWRVEHITGDQTFNSSMLVSPVDASLRMTEFLKTYIVPLEKLSKLTIGFVGGGEHATGIMARNQHVLPAPVASAPRTWLSNHVTEPDPRTIITFNHIKDLTVQNAWVSPLMLEAFMTKSQDTSLRTLTLDSISLTATHGQRLVAPLTTANEFLDPIHPPSMWLHETLPTTHCWPAVIDRITPGATFLDRRYDAGLVADTYTNPQPPPSFRGFVSRLIFKSCGYVRISGVSIQEFNQNDLVYPNTDPVDAGLKARAAALAEKGIMLSDKNPSTGAEWPLLGKLVQSVHPIEKRVLEEAWRMRFGWEDELERWASVEDGQFEGGTGRFSGVIVGEGGKGISLPTERK